MAHDCARGVFLIRQLVWTWTLLLPLQLLQPGPCYAQCPCATGRLLSGSQIMWTVLTLLCVATPNSSPTSPFHGSLYIPTNGE